MKQFLTAVALLILCSCSQDDPLGFKGYYSFKTGGSLVLSGTVTDSEGETRDTTFTRHLIPESGQMHVLRGEGDKMIVTMNITGGDPVVFDAYLSNDVLTLEPVFRSAPVRVELGDESIRGEFTVSGKGRKYENMLLIDLDYKGTLPITDFEGEVTSSDVHCVATENE